MQLLKHFKELTVHPKNAEQLKGLILQLAIQGKLTQKWREQNPDVESASVLLEKIKEEKAQLVKEKKIKKEKALPEITEEEMIDDIPNSWAVTRLGVIGNWGAGATPLRSRSDFYGGNINWFKSGELNNGIMDYDSEEKINELAIENSSLRLNKVGDVLIAMYGATIGKTGLLAVEGATNQAVCACTTFSCISNIYLHLLLKALKSTFTNQGEGGAQPNISRVKIRNQVFVLPPLEEQKVIVSIVNQLFAEVDQLEAQTKERVQLKNDFVTSALRQLSNVKEVNGEWAYLQQHFKSFFNTKEAVKKLRECILQLAVQGKLTHHWRGEHPTVEPASVLLEKIKVEKEQLIKEKKIKKEKALPEITKGEILYELPDGWVWCRLGEALLYSDAGKSPNCEKRPVTKNEWGVLTTTAIQQNWFDETANKVLPDKFEINKQQIVEIGDILITRAGPINRTGVACKVDRLNYKLILSDKTIRLKYIPESLYPDCIVQFLNSTEIRALLLDKMIGMASSQVNISQANIKGIPFPLPPLEEQKAIVAKVNSLMALCDQLEQQIELSSNQVEELMESCLKEVFSIDSNS